MSKISDKNDGISEDLQELGLDKNEAIVYLSLLKLGEVGASKIVRDTSMHGQTVYDALYNLESKNLVRHNVEKGRKKFLAQSPSILIDLIERKKKVASEIVEKIEQKFSTLDFQDIEILKGQESFISNEFKILKEMPEDSILLVFGGTGDSFIKNLKNQYNEYDFQRNKKNILVKYIGSEKQKEYLTKSKDTRKNFEYKFLSDVFSGVTNICVFGTIAINIYLYDETVTTITIRNKKIVESYIDFFNSLWTLGK
jgi:sugar-specific transcriptional regulator TrmB